MQHITMIVIEDGGKCEVRTNRKRALYRLHKLHSLYPLECVHTGNGNGYECWKVPFYWMNCQKRNEPSPLSPDDVTRKEDKE